MKNKFIFTKTVLTSLVMLCPQLIFSQSTISPPPSGFDSCDSNIPQGKSEIVSYYSSTVGINRNTRVLLPPGYTEDSTYNVLYLLHGIGGDINEWYSQGVASIFDYMCSEAKIAPMIVVLPNGRAMVDDSPGGDIFAADKVAGFANFEIELIKDLIPFIDTTYSVKRNREARAIAGLSMGGGQALNFGLAHLDTFAWVGAFSPAPNTKAANMLLPDLEDSAKLSGLWISCGTADGLLYIAKNTHEFMAQNKISHYYVVEPGKGHDFSVWKPGFYYFAHMIFGKKLDVDTTAYNGVSQLIKKEVFNIVYDFNNQIIRILYDKPVRSINIFDINGRIVPNLNVDNNIVNVSHLSSGVYFIMLYDGNKALQQKFVKY